jgi:hypothetical protein
LQSKALQIKKTPTLFVTLSHQDIVYDQILFNGTSNYQSNILNGHVNKNKQNKQIKQNQINHTPI